MDEILGCYVMGFTYLASPFEHKNPDVMEARCESVRLITSSLVAKGDVVFSPIAYTENSELPEPPQGWLKFDLAMLQCADLLLIACMPGHQDSAGIKQEIEFAKKHDIKTKTLEPKIIQEIIGATLWERSKGNV